MLLPTWKGLNPNPDWGVSNPVGPAVSVCLVFWLRRVNKSELWSAPQCYLSAYGRARSDEISDYRDYGKNGSTGPEQVENFSEFSSCQYLGPVNLHLRNSHPPLWPNNPFKMENTDFRNSFFTNSLTTLGQGPINERKSQRVFADDLTTVEPHLDLTNTGPGGQ